MKLRGDDSESLEHITGDCKESKLQIWEHKNFVMEEGEAIGMEDFGLHDPTKSVIHGDDHGHLQSVVVVGGTTPLP